MVTTPAHIARIAFTRRASCASRWPAGQRAQLAKSLAALGTGITELSDVRERCGLPRLSESTPEARRLAHLILLGKRGQAALAAVRSERSLLLGALESSGRNAVQLARAYTGIRGTLSELRLGELAALYAQTRIIEIAREGK